MEVLVVLAIVIVFGLPIMAILIAIGFSGRLTKLEHQLTRVRSDLRTHAARPHRPIPLSMRLAHRAQAAAPRALAAPAQTPAPQTPPAQPATPPPSPEPAAQRPPIPTSPTSPQPTPPRPTTPPVRPVPFTPSFATAAKTASSTAAAATPSASARKPRRFEEQLGARLFVWIGSIALFLAGAFLVKYTFDAGLLTPRTRVGLGAAFGLALLIAGEWLRKRAPRIAQGVTAAGVADLFASFLAAYSLYHLVDSTVGFTLLAINTALAVVLSLRQGPFVALLGLIGGFVTPALIGSVEPRPGPLFAYLFALQLGLLAVVRRRRWWPLAALTILASFAWVGVWLALSYRSEHSIWIGPFLVGSIAAFISSLYRKADDSTTRAAWERGLSIAGALAGLLLLALLVGASGFSNIDWLFLGLLGAGLIVLGRADKRYALLPWFGAAAGAALLIAWQVRTAQVDAARFGAVTLGLGVLYALGAYAAIWRAPHPALWASLSVAAAIAHLLLAYWGLPAAPFRCSWGGICLLLAAVYAVLCVPVVRLRAATPAYNLALAALLTAVTVFVSLAVPIELERAWIAVAWAFEIPALAIVAAWLRVPALRVLAAALAALTTIWLFQPGALNYPLGPDSFFDWILYGYGLSALAFALGAWLFHRQGATVLAGALQAGVVLFTFALVTLKVRHFFSPVGLTASALDLRESASYVVSWYVLGGIILLAARGLSQRVLRIGGQVICAIAACVALLALCLVLNPLSRPTPLGSTPVFNLLLYVYGVPALLAFLVSSARFQNGAPATAGFHATVGVILTTVLATLEVRHYFFSENLALAQLLLHEAATYASVLIALGGVALLVSRIWQQPVMWAAGQVLTLFGALAALIGPGVLLNPLWRSHDFGVTPVLNMLLYVYGLPGLLALLTAGDLCQTRKQSTATFNSCIGVALLFLLVSLEIRHFWHPSEMGQAVVLLREWSTYASGWIIFGAALLWLSRIWRPEVLRPAAYIDLTFAALVIVLALCLFDNPLWNAEPVGARPIVNWLLYAYGVPAVLAGAAAALTTRLAAHPLARAAGCAALLLVFVLVSLEVSQWFRGTYLVGGVRSSDESYAYSAAWVALGTLLLLAGILTHGFVLRWASLTVMLLAVGKVFLLDTARLRDLYRVFSLLGLGLSLLLLAFLYQRFVFGRPQLAVLPPDPQPEPQSPSRLGQEP